MVAFVPTMKSLKDGNTTNEAGVQSALDDAMAQVSEALAQQLETLPVTEREPIDFSKVEIEPLFQEFVDFETFSKSDFRAVKVLACEAVKPYRSPRSF